MKTKKETINISSTWENVLPQYVRMYSSLNMEGKKEMLRRLSVLGKIVDKTIKFHDKNKSLKEKKEKLNRGIYE
jgi:hypothetical protein